MYDEEMECSFPGCERVTWTQTDDERKHDVGFCDPSGLLPEEGNHYLQFEDAVDAGKASEWLDQLGV